MQIDLNDSTVALSGEHNAISDAVLSAVKSNGASVAAPPATPDLLLISLPLIPGQPVRADDALEEARRIGQAMGEKGQGRILFLYSALAGLPVRRHPHYSAQMSAAQAGMRALAMELGPAVLVNGLGVGCIGEPAVAGESVMVGHAGLPRAGTVAEVVGAALFLCDPLNSYTTGQTLNVDGGWIVGYGRNF